MESLHTHPDSGIVWLHEWRYLEGPARDRFVADFVAAWAKVMDADRFDLGRGDGGSR